MSEASFDMVLQELRDTAPRAPERLRDRVPRCRLFRHGGRSDCDPHSRPRSRLQLRWASEQQSSGASPARPSSSARAAVPASGGTSAGSNGR